MFSAGEWWRSDTIAGLTLVGRLQGDGDDDNDDSASYSFCKLKHRVLELFLWLNRRLFFSLQMLITCSAGGARPAFGPLIVTTTTTSGRPKKKKKMVPAAAALCPRGRSSLCFHLFRK